MNDLIKNLAGQYRISEDNFRYLDNGVLIALLPMMTTWGVAYGLDKDGLQGRFCYQNLSDAQHTFDTVTVLDAENIPDDVEWIKHKGRKEFSNPKREWD